jgi:xylulokinase
MTHAVCCIDLGTTRVKAAFIDAEGGIIAFSGSGEQEFKKEYGIRGLDAAGIFNTVCELVKSCFEKGNVNASEVKAVVVTGQRATVLPVDAKGLPLTPAIPWHDTNCEKDIELFIKKMGADRFTEITGLPPSALWSLGKILWYGKTSPELYGKTGKFVLLNDYVNWRFGADLFITDYSSASVFGLLDLNELSWSDEMCREAGVRKDALPLLVGSGTEIGKINGETAQATGLLEGTPLIAGGGDQQCAALGAGAVSQGDASLCLGTAAVISCPLDRPMIGLYPGLFCTANVLRGMWMLEGINNSFSGAIDWACGILGVGKTVNIDRIYNDVPPGAGGITFFPFLSGIGSPDYKAGVRGAFLGLDTSHGKEEIIRAVIEGIVMETYRIIESIAGHFDLKGIILSGGPSALKSITSCFANLAGMDVYLNRNTETTLLGAALLATAKLEGAPVEKIAGAWASPAMEKAEPGDDANGLRRAYNLYLERIEAARKYSVKTD